MDCVTVWLICENWNCRISPGLAFTSAGVKTSDLLTVGEPTTMAMIFDFELAVPVPVVIAAVLVAALLTDLAPLEVVPAGGVVSTVRNSVVRAEEQGGRSTEAKSLN